MPSLKRIPIKSAKSIGQDFGYTQVIITAFDKETGITSVVTWGKSQEDCEQAALGGNFVKKALGWPPEKCNDKPARQLRREQREAQEEENELSNPKLLKRWIKSQLELAEAKNTIATLRADNKTLIKKMEYMEFNGHDDKVIE